MNNTINIDQWIIQLILINEYYTDFERWVSSYVASFLTYVNKPCWKYNCVKIYDFYFYLKQFSQNSSIRFFDLYVHFIVYLKYIWVQATKSGLVHTQQGEVIYSITSPLDNQRAVLIV
jgi:hypothetical protein